MRKSYFITPSFESVMSTANVLDSCFPVEQLKMFGGSYYADIVTAHFNSDIVNESSQHSISDALKVPKYYSINSYLFSAHSIEPIDALDLGDIIKDKKNSTFYRVIRADVYSCAIEPLDNKIDDFIESEDIHQTNWNKTYEFIEPMSIEPSIKTDLHVEKDLESKKNQDSKNLSKEIISLHKEFPIYSKVLSLKDFKTYIVISHVSYGVIISNPSVEENKDSLSEIIGPTDEIEVIHVHDVDIESNVKYIKLADPENAGYSVGMPFREDQLLFTSKNDVDMLLSEYAESLKSRLPADLIDVTVEKIVENFKITRL